MTAIGRLPHAVTRGAVLDAGATADSIPTMKTVRAKAYSSIANLGYGFDVFAVCVDAASDEVELSLGGRGITLEVEGNGAGAIPTRPDRNTAGVALAKLMSDHGLREPVRVRLRKRFRPVGGLGSSAASAAAAVVAANRLFGLGLPRARLVPYAAHGETASAGAPHADNVAAAVLGGFVIAEKRDPARILRIAPRGPLRFAIAMPRLELTTAAARRVLPESVSLEEYSQGCARAGVIVAAIASGDVGALGRAIEGSFAERARAPLVPGYAEVCESARRAGAAGATMRFGSNSFSTRSPFTGSSRSPGAVNESQPPEYQTIRGKPPARVRASTAGPESGLEPNRSEWSQPMNATAS